MLKEQMIPIAEIYIPTGRRKTLDAAKAEALAEDILENGQQVPIQVRQGKGRFVLVEGLHRLEACISLGDEQISAFLVQARKF
ncbi:MAG: ParB N-terminal domain-containing protein [Alphaproteobacteria bacterium]|jgi:sulfiredoxin|nr:ParB N-terminal domain-containing protein [Alphaproteobacteria bacterium]MBT7943861.1 ParB N-terminal domain-containing protein [Alphaproteobacteria bacterium]